MPSQSLDTETQASNGHYQYLRLHEKIHRRYGPKTGNEQGTFHKILFYSILFVYGPFRLINQVVEDRSV